MRLLCDNLSNVHQQQTWVVDGKPSTLLLFTQEASFEFQNINGLQITVTAGGHPDTANLNYINGRWVFNGGINFQSDIRGDIVRVSCLA
ncbi:hypothetical protein [Bacillus sp. FSL M8-0077]|uniref:hypothetical protein n=1 Tax=Bacillus sp. FSL M8-0077 TaxID=2954556 RepID=UPI00115122CF